MFSKKLANSTIIMGKCQDNTTLCAWFQIWARSVGISTEYSLAMWLYDDLKSQIFHYGTDLLCANKLALEGFEMLEGLEVPFLSRKLIDKIYEQEG